MSVVGEVVVVVIFLYESFLGKPLGCGGGESGRMGGGNA